MVENVEYVTNYINIMLENDKSFSSLYDLLEVCLLEEKNYNIRFLARKLPHEEVELIIDKYQQCINKIEKKFPNEKGSLDVLKVLINDLRIIIQNTESTYED